MLHVISCNCKNKECLGFFFVPEKNCPLCIPDATQTVIFPDHFEHASVDRVGKCMDKWFQHVKNYIREYIAIDRDLISDNSDTETESESDSNSGQSLPTVIDRSIEVISTTTRGRGRGRGRGRAARGNTE